MRHFWVYFGEASESDVMMSRAVRRRHQEFITDGQPAGLVGIDLSGFLGDGLLFKRLSPSLHLYPKAAITHFYADFSSFK